MSVQAGDFGSSRFRYDSAFEVNRSIARSPIVVVQRAQPRSERQALALSEPTTDTLLAQLETDRLTVLAMRGWFDELLVTSR